MCVNSLPLTKGLITRSRNVAGVIQKSVVDFYVVCELVLPFISQMKIDSDKKHLLTNYKPALLDLKVCDSDHMVLSMDLNLKGVFKKVNKIEVFNFNDEMGQKIFNDITSKTSEFTDCFQSDLPVNEQLAQWKDKLLLFCSRALKKIRIRTKNLKGEKSDVLINKRNNLVKNKAKVEEIEEIEGKSKADKFKDFL